MSLYKGNFVHPCLMCRYTHKPMCRNCGKEGVLVGKVIMCKNCNSNFDKDTCEELSTKQALRKVLMGIAEEEE